VWGIWEMDKELEDLNGRENVGELDADGRIILKLF
jgi:hypothetical protein